MRTLVAGEETIVPAQANDPSPRPGEALIAVGMIGLNRGDLRVAASVKPGTRLGWDFAGRIAVAARGGEGEGVRVAGLLTRPGAWAQRVAAYPDLFAPIPDDLDDATAAALPSAGLTALYALEDMGPLLGRRLLVTGASGGVGHLACQLGKIGGAQVTGLVRSAESATLLDRLGVASTTEIAGPYDLVLETVGGDTLAAAIGALAPEGLCVTLGVTGGRETMIDAFAFYQQRKRLQGFGVFPTIAAGRLVRAGLGRLLALAAAGTLSVEIGWRGSWTEIATAANALNARGFYGKAVLGVDE